MLPHVSTLTKITALSLLASEASVFSPHFATADKVFSSNRAAKALSEVRGFHLQQLNEMSSFIKAGMIFNFSCHYIGSEQRHLLLEVKV